jgi:hypothetical protein
MARNMEKFSILQGTPEWKEVLACMEDEEVM